MKLTSACSRPVMTALLRTWLKSASQKPWADSHRLPDSPAGPSPAAGQPRLLPKSASFQVSRSVTQRLGPDPSHTGAQPERALTSHRQQQRAQARGVGGHWLSAVERGHPCDPVGLGQPSPVPLKRAPGPFPGLAAAALNRRLSSQWTWAGFPSTGWFIRSLSSGWA